jgi:aspartyl-tRNA(Asn)/glutamyl-tRNA(Gln) amidotransferase subunit C
VSSKVQIDRQRVRDVAKLAALSLTEDEEDALAHDLDAIVRYVEELDALDTRDVPPTTSVLIGTSALRDDEAQPCLSHEDALAAAPRVENDGFAVPAFVDAEK